MREVVSDAFLGGGDIRSDGKTTDNSARRVLGSASALRPRRAWAELAAGIQSPEVPQGYAEAWERIWHEFENRYDLADP